MSEKTETPQRHTFVIKLTDRPGGMELIAATFAHRGLSLTTTLGNDGARDASGHATVLVHFEATPARKEAVRASLARLSRVVSLQEYAENDAQVRQTALVRLVSGTPLPHAPDVWAEFVGSSDGSSDGAICVLLGLPESINALLDELRESKSLLAVTQAVLAV